MSKSKRKPKRNAKYRREKADTSSRTPPKRLRIGRSVLVAISLFVVGTAAYVFYPPSDANSLESLGVKMRGMKAGKLTVHWDPLDEGRESQLIAKDSKSNIHPEDYAGPESCQECHKENYAGWSKHPHRFMNALATQENVVGDFSGESSIDYLDTRGEFYKSGDEFRMNVEHEGELHVYRVNQTIGSRFFQYYVGKGIEGKSPKGHYYYREDHVLPFGYWIDRDMWVPVVHVNLELPDEGGRWNPLDPPNSEGRVGDLVYARGCNNCHTTFPLADMFVRRPDLMGEHAPTDLFFSIGDYIQEHRGNLVDGNKPSAERSDQEFLAAVQSVSYLEAEDEAASLGVSCEACHLGCRAHAEGKEAKPSFLPHGPHLATLQSDASLDTGRTVENLNWACSRCHVGGRPSYAGGMATWNSTEFSDAHRGACYSEMTCVHCHDPHQPIGKEWSRPPAEDDAVCLSCHQEFDDPGMRLGHTHHPAGSSGDHCLNCHMPKINEGMQDVVRTHTIYSPTKADMIEANHPNACNLCHLDKPIDWTLKSLEDWYGKRYSPAKIVKNYPMREEAVGLGWLDHPAEAVRLVATDMLSKAKATWALPQLIEQLDDDYLLNRQFALQGIEDMLDIRLIDYGYRFYMSRTERRSPLGQIRQALIESSAGLVSQPPDSSEPQ